MNTLLSSFSQALPDITSQMFGDQREGRVHKSGTNTIRCRPPSCAFEIPVSHWTEKADQLCLADQNHRSKLQEGYMPGYKASQLINSEEDVVNASALYFTHPVNTALSLVHPEDSYLCEVIKGKDPSGPPKTSSLSRVDRMYFKGRPKDWKSPGSSENTMACLEFKRLMALNQGAFGNTIVTTSQAYKGRVAAARAGDARYGTEENVATLLSQATHYAIKFKTPFVALFDYHTLILLVMTQVVEEDGYGGDFTYMTVVTDSSQLRKAFLGFLLCAHQHADGNGNWQKARDGKDILVKDSDLGSMDIRGGAGPSSSRSNPARGPKRTYTERDSQGSSPPASQSNDHAEHKTAHSGSVRTENGRKPSTLAKSSPNLSMSSTSSRDTGSRPTSSSSATTVSSTGSGGNAGTGHGPGPAAHPAPPKGGVKKTPGPPLASDSSTRNKSQPMTIPVRSKPDAPKKKAPAQG